MTDQSIIYHSENKCDNYISFFAQFDFNNAYEQKEFMLATPCIEESDASVENTSKIPEAVLNYLLFIFFIYVEYESLVTILTTFKITNFFEITVINMFLLLAFILGFLYVGHKLISNFIMKFVKNNTYLKKYIEIKNVNTNKNNIFDIYGLKDNSHFNHFIEQFSDQISLLKNVLFQFEFIQVYQNCLKDCDFYNEDYINSLAYQYDRIITFLSCKDYEKAFISLLEFEHLRRKYIEQNKHY